METWFEDIRNVNAGMSSEKQCKKHCRLKFKVFKGRINHLDDNKSAPKKINESFV